MRYTATQQPLQTSELNLSSGSVPAGDPADQLSERAPQAKGSNRQIINQTSYQKNTQIAKKQQESIIELFKRVRHLQNLQHNSLSNPDTMCLETSATNYAIDELVAQNNQLQLQLSYAQQQNISLAEKLEKVTNGATLPLAEQLETLRVNFWARQRLAQVELQAKDALLEKLQRENQRLKHVISKIGMDKRHQCGALTKSNLKTSKVQYQQGPSKRSQLSVYSDSCQNEIKVLKQSVANYQQQLCAYEIRFDTQQEKIAQMSSLLASNYTNMRVDEATNENECTPQQSHCLGKNKLYDQRLTENSQFAKEMLDAQEPTKKLLSPETELQDTQNSLIAVPPQDTGGLAHIALQHEQLPTINQSLVNNSIDVLEQNRKDPLTSSLNDSRAVENKIFGDNVNNQKDATENCTGNKLQDQATEQNIIQQLSAQLHTKNEIISLLRQQLNDLRNGCKVQQDTQNTQEYEQKYAFQLDQARQDLSDIRAILKQQQSGEILQTHCSEKSTHCSLRSEGEHQDTPVQLKYQLQCNTGESEWQISDFRQRIAQCKQMIKQLRGQCALYELYDIGPQHNVENSTNNAAAVQQQSQSERNLQQEPDRANEPQNNKWSLSSLRDKIDGLSTSISRLEIEVSRQQETETFAYLKNQNNTLMQLEAEIKNTDMQLSTCVNQLSLQQQNQPIHVQESNSVPQSPKKVHDQLDSQQQNHADRSDEKCEEVQQNKNDAPPKGVLGPLDESEVQREKAVLEMVSQFFGLENQ